MTKYNVKQGIEELLRRDGSMQPNSFMSRGDVRGAVPLQRHFTEAELTPPSGCNYQGFRAWLAGLDEDQQLRYWETAPRGKDSPWAYPQEGKE
jgi:hypothetical protein